MTIQGNDDDWQCSRASFVSAGGLAGGYNRRRLVLMGMFAEDGGGGRLHVGDCWCEENEGWRSRAGCSHRVSPSHTACSK